MSKKIDGYRTTMSDEQEKQVEELAKDFRMSGMSDEDADKKAREDIEKTIAIADDNYSNFVKKHKLYDILDDLIRRSFLRYEEEYQKMQAKLGNKDTIKFKLELQSDRTHGAGSMLSRTLVFSIARNGVWKVYNRKEIKFGHIKDIRDKESDWKFSIYEAFFNGLVFNGITYMLMTNDARKSGDSEPQNS